MMMRETERISRSRAAPMDFERDAPQKQQLAFQSSQSAAASISLHGGPSAPSWLTSITSSQQQQQQQQQQSQQSGYTVGGLVGHESRASSLSPAKHTPMFGRLGDASAAKFSFSHPEPHHLHSHRYQKNHSGQEQKPQGYRSRLGSLVSSLNLSSSSEPAGIDSDDASPQIARKRKKTTDPVDPRIDNPTEKHRMKIGNNDTGTSGGFSRNGGGQQSSQRDFAHHLIWPYVIIGYLRLAFTLFMTTLTTYLLIQFVMTIHHDLQMKAEEYSAEIAQQVLDCAKSYATNRCSVNERVPAMEAQCVEWELCMGRDPREVGRLKVGAETIAEILNRLFEPMTYKTMLFGSVLFFGSVWLWSTAPSLSSLRPSHIHNSIAPSCWATSASHASGTQVPHPNQHPPLPHVPSGLASVNHHYYGVLPGGMTDMKASSGGGSLVSRRGWRDGGSRASSSSNGIAIDSDDDDV